MRAKEEGPSHVWDKEFTTTTTKNNTGRDELGFFIAKKKLIRGLPEKGKDEVEKEKDRMGMGSNGGASS